MIDQMDVKTLSYTTFFDNDKFNRNKVKESWVKSHYPIDYSNIITFCQNKKIQSDIFSQKLYHYVLNIDKVPICLKCEINYQRYSGFNIGYNQFCSKGCASSFSFKRGYEKRIENTINKYGVSHTTQLDEVREKMKSTNKKRYGVEHASQSTSIFEKIKETNRKRYGVDLPLQNKDILEKSIKNSSESYQSNIEKIQSKIKENSIKKWGCEWPIQSMEVKNKIKKSIDASISNKIFDTYKDHEEIKFLKYEDGSSKFLCLNCNKEFSITSHLLYQRHIKHDIQICTNCNKLNNRTSNGHIEISDFLKENEINFKMNVRNIISPSEIDIYLPDQNIGIEFNGVYWHSEIIKDKKYHLNKRILCRDKNIDLIQIWEDDWKLKKDIIKSILLSRIGKNSIIKMGRKLKIDRIFNEKLVKDFLNVNHLQGWSLSGIKYGLFENEDLISIMTFSKSRKNVNNKGWELVRFCNRLNHSVLGSFNKLINRFIKDFNPESIISYSDNDIFNGDSYKRIGMEKVNESLNYWWCDGKVRHNRWKFRKDQLISQGEDSSISGTQIMINKGYFRCWGSGTTTWKLVHQSSNK